jgi:8-oxo-dGTP pyrophosphatase MutT (NUDIX family)
MSFTEGLRHHLRSRRRNVLDATTSHPCGVLLALVPAQDDYRVLYTLRSEALPSHKGQVAFPGGRRSQGDASLLDTALREAEEEVGLAREDVVVLGALDDVYTMATDFRITPFVGVIPPDYRFRADPREVADIFTVGIAELLDPRHHGVTRREWRGASYPVDVITAGPHAIWGATHAMTLDLIDCIRAIR